MGVMRLESVLDYRRKRRMIGMISVRPISEVESVSRLTRVKFDTGSKSTHVCQNGHRSNYTQGAF